jgi:hypothetical protein
MLENEFKKTCVYKTFKETTENNNNEDYNKIVIIIIIICKYRTQSVKINKNSNIFKKRFDAGVGGCPRLTFLFRAYNINIKKAHTFTLHTFLI